jgi:hypothetical protein
MILRRLVWLVLVFVWLKHGGSSSSSSAEAAATACTRARQAQFQYPDCYLPELNPNLLLSEASFLLSHDAATGYMTRNVRSKSGLARRYTQTQVTSTFYDQLDDGARALDIRPLLLKNGTIVFQHGVIRIDNVDIYTAMEHVLQWCKDNPSELVLLLPSHFAYESTTTVSFSSRTTNGDGSITVDDEVLAYYDNIADYNDNDNNADDSEQAVFDALSRALATLGIPVYECTDVYQWTVADAMAAAALNNNNAGGGGGYVMALMNPSGMSCAKENWLANEIVTCYPKNNKTTTCTTSDVPWHSMQSYLLQSANNAASDNNDQLGPPADLYNTPLFEIQALWQIDTHAVLAGMAHWSSILNDNRQSHVNEKVVRMVYDDSFQSISLLAVDNIARHGNALTSVLRNRCGQLADVSLPCGTNLPPPRLRYVHVTPTQWLLLALSFYTVWFGYSVLYLRRPKLLYTAIARWREHHQNNNSTSTTTFMVEKDTKRDDLLGTNERAS